MILAVIDKAIAFLKEKEKNKEKLFNNFVEPVYEAFEKAHLDYMDSFKKYRDFVNGQEPELGFNLYDLQKRINEDSQGTYQLRSACMLSIEPIQSSTRYDFSPLIESINTYFNDRSTTSEFLNNQNHPIVLYINCSRTRLMSYISFLDLGTQRDDYKEFLTQHISTLIDEVQMRRDIVHKEYLKAKKELLVS